MIFIHSSCYKGIDYYLAFSCQACNLKLQGQLAMEKAFLLACVQEYPAARGSSS